MPRLKEDEWERARADYEVNGMSFKAISGKYKVDIAAVSRRAKKQGWIQSQSQTLVDKKVKAVREYMKAESQSQTLSQAQQQAIDSSVKDRLEMEGLFINFERELALKGIEFTKVAADPAQLELLSRVIKNIRSQPQQTTVNVTQQQANIVQKTPEEVCDELIAQQEAENGADI